MIFSIARNHFLIQGKDAGVLCDLLFMFSVTEICDFWNMREPSKGLKPPSRQIGPLALLYSGFIMKQGYYVDL